MSNATTLRLTHPDKYGAPCAELASEQLRGTGATGISKLISSKVLVSSTGIGIDGWGLGNTLAAKYGRHYIVEVFNLRYMPNLFFLQC